MQQPGHRRGEVETGKTDSGFAAASVCECGVVISARGADEIEALERHNVEWVVHLRAVAPWRPGEPLEVAAAQYGGTTKWVGQLFSPDPRMYRELWRCEHRHETRADAIVCAHAELDRRST